MNSDPWNQELSRLGIFLAGMWLMGYLLHSTFLFLFIAFFIYSIRSIYYLNRLYNWLHGEISFLSPKIPGLWGDVYLHFSRLQRRNRKRKRKLKLVIDRFRKSASSMADAAVIIEQSGEIKWFNKTATRILGLRGGKKGNLHSINALMKNPEFDRFLANKKNNEVLEIPSPIKPEHYLSIDAVPYGKKQLLLLAKDVTRIRRLEKTRQDFVANVSHELKTPLTVINGYAETLGEIVDPNDATTLRIVDQMMKQSNRMQRLVDDLLLLSRLETGEIKDEREKVNVPNMVNRLYDEAFTFSNGKHLITADCDDTLILRGHESELYCAFSNLITNAIRYTPENREIRIRWHLDDDGAHFSVQDTGDGIAKEHLSRLTERFYRVDVGRSRSSGGTGLGLAIVKHVMLRYDGELHIESELNQGSLFRCDFPHSVIQRKYLVDKTAI